jgi:ubiquinone biosynthesis accessory factor UbiJ
MDASAAKSGQFNSKLSEQLMIKQALTLALEKIINKALSLNTRDNSVLSALENKQLTLLLTELNFALSFSVYQQKILVTSLSENSNCTITTSLRTLKELQKNHQLTELIKQDQLDISGDLKVAQQFANFAENLTIDWQSELAKYIGSFATYKLGRVAKAISSKFTFFVEQVQADSSEYLVHEKKLVVTKNQLDEFNYQVKNVDQQADNLLIRLADLDKQLT